MMQKQIDFAVLVKYAVVNRVGLSIKLKYNNI